MSRMLYFSYQSITLSLYSVRVPYKQLAQIHRIRKPITETAAASPGFAFVEGELIQVCNQGIGPACRISLGDGPDNRKRVKYIDNVQYRTYGKRRIVPVEVVIWNSLLPVIGTIYRSCFIIIQSSILCRPDRTVEGDKWNRLQRYHRLSPTQSKRLQSASS